MNGFCQKLVRQIIDNNFAILVAQLHKNGRGKLIAQQFGFTLPQIREVLDKLPNGRTPNKADWTDIGETFRVELDRKIETLTELRNRLDKCVGCGCLSLTDCTLYNPQDRAGKKGTGPRYLMGDKPENP